ncbi:MAG: PKD domain-containing protein [Chitinophagales bacterium]|nr:PKD domain-containing protein [Bacteroidota bacterium]
MKKLFIILASISTLLISSCKEDCVSPEKHVTASFTVDEIILNAVSIANVQMNNTSTGATTYHWDFGDGSTSTEENPAHYYSTNGTYTIKLTASDGGVSAIATRDVYIYDDAFTKPTEN